jgi:colicin import membrane protein
MWQAIRKHPRAVLGAILAHLIFVAILVVSFRFSEAPLMPVGEPQEIIEAEAIDEKVIQAELDRIKAAEQRKQDEARKAREAKLQEQRRKEELKKQKAAEEKQRQAEAKKRKEQAAAEKQRLAELEKKRKEELAAEKKRQDAERKRKEEEARLAKLEQERKEKEKQEALQAEIARQEAVLQKQLEADRLARQAEAQRQAQQSVIDKYKRDIQDKIERKWNIPATASEELKCKVKVRLSPGGDVVVVQILESSGDVAFDNSVENAIYRAVPLPIPPVDSGLFDEFREVDFTFDRRNRV